MLGGAKPRRAPRRTGRRRARKVALGIGNLRVPVHSHIAHFLTRPDDLAELVGVVEAGLRRQDHAVVAGSRAMLGRMLALLAEHGFDVEALTAAGRLATVSGSKTTAALLATYGAALRRSVAAGAPLVRLVGVPAWGDADWPSDARLFAVEESLGALARSLPVLIVCAYDVAGLPEATLERGGRRSHASLTVQGRLLDSGGSVAAGRFVASLGEALRSQAERRRAEDALAHERARLEAITDVALSYLGLDDLLRVLLARVRGALGVEIAVVRMLDEGGQVLVVRAVDGVPFERLAPVRLPVDSAAPIRLDAPYIDNELKAPAAGSDDWYAQVWAAVGLPLRSTMGVPLRVEGRAIGVLYVASVRTPIAEEDQRLLRIVADRMAPAIERCRTLESLGESGRRLAALSKRLLEVQEAERREVARELHDEMGQLLTGLLFRIEGHDGSTGDLKGEIKAIVNDLISRVHNLSMTLRPPMLDALGLLPALNWQVDRFQTQTGIRVRFRQAGLDRRFASEVEIAAFRVVQEALTNVARHAGVRAVDVEVRADDGELQARVEDQGRGFDVEATLAAHPSGLMGMRERSRLLGGRLVIGSKKGTGTQIRLEVPLVSGADTATHR
jgi:signal transduction histidine kinase